MLNFCLTRWARNLYRKELQCMECSLLLLFWVLLLSQFFVVFWLKEIKFSVCILLQNNEYNELSLAKSHLYHVQIAAIHNMWLHLLHSLKDLRTWESKLLKCQYDLSLHCNLLLQCFHDALKITNNSLHFRKSYICWQISKRMLRAGEWWSSHWYSTTWFLNFL